MDFTNVLALIGGVAMFLFGMSVMGDALEKSAGSRLSSLLDKLTSNPLKGFALGAVLAAEYTANHEGFLGMNDLFQF